MLQTISTSLTCSHVSDLNDHAHSRGWCRWNANGLKNVTWWWQITRYRGAASYQHPSVTGQWGGMLPWQESHKAGSRLQTGQDTGWWVWRDTWCYMWLHRVDTHDTHTQTDVCTQSWCMIYRDTWQTYLKEEVHSFSTRDVSAIIYTFNNHDVSHFLMTTTDKKVQKAHFMLGFIDFTLARLLAKM